MLASPKFCATEQYGLLEESLRRRGLLALLRRSLLETQLSWCSIPIRCFVSLFSWWNGFPDFFSTILCFCFCLPSPAFFVLVNTLNYEALEWKYCKAWGFWEGHRQSGDRYPGRLQLRQNVVLKSYSNLVQQHFCGTGHKTSTPVLVRVNINNKFKWLIIFSCLILQVKIKYFFSVSLSFPAVF